MITIFIILIYVISIPPAYLGAVAIFARHMGTYEHKKHWIVLFVTLCPFVNAFIAACVICIFLLGYVSDKRS